METATYDILNCGPRHQFWANGAIVHNSDKLNLQNLPRGSTLRRAIIAPKGQVIVALDSSNIEARMVAWEAGHEELLKDFRNKVDIYLKFASNHVYKRPLTKEENPLERQVGKIACLGLSYGMGPDKFQDTLAIGAMGPPVYITREDSVRIVHAYRSVNAPIVNLWSRADAALTAMLQGESWEVLPKSDCLKTMRNMMVMPNGMALQYPALTVSYDDRNRPQFEYYNGKYMSKIYGGKGVENITQALARIVLFWQMLEIAKRIKPYGGRVILNVHDEIVFTIPAMGAYKAGIDSKGKDIWEKSDELDAVVNACMGIMRTPPPWCPDLPLDCEGGYDYCYSK